MRVLITILALVFSCQLLAGEYFLDEAERAKLTPHSKVPGVLNHWFPDVDLGNYENMLFGGVTLYFSEDSKYKEIDPEEVKAISDGMRAAMVQATNGKINVAQEPGPSTLLLNVAIVKIKLAKKKRGLLGYTPVGLVVTTAQDMAGMRMKLRNAMVEGEVLDSQTGELLAIFRVEEIPKQEGAADRTWEDVTSVFEELMEKGIIAAKN